MKKSIKYFEKNNNFKKVSQKKKEKTFNKSLNYKKNLSILRNPYINRGNNYDNPLFRIKNGITFDNKNKLIIDNFYTFLITLSRDNWKRERLHNSMKDSNQFIDYKIWNGVNLNNDKDNKLIDWVFDSKLGHISDLGLKGNIGSSLAHLTLWNYISQQKDNNNYLILEDNAIIKSYLNDIISKLIKLDYDMIYLVAQGPYGESTQIDDLLRLIPNKYTNILQNCNPNVLLSSYLLRSSGAKKLLKYYKKKNFDLSKDIIDQAISVALHSQPDIKEKMKIYVINHRKYFDNIQTGGDSRLLFNEY